MNTKRRRRRRSKQPNKIWLLVLRLLCSAVARKEVNCEARGEPSVGSPYRFLINRFLYLKKFLQGLIDFFYRPIYNIHEDVSETS